MAMNMEQANSSSENERAWQCELLTFSNPPSKIDLILAHNIVHKKCDRHVLHIVSEGLADAIIHINLSVGSVTSASVITHIIDNLICTSLPFGNL